jgi:hypothetical protein
MSMSSLSLSSTSSSSCPLMPSYLATRLGGSSPDICVAGAARSAALASPAIERGVPRGASAGGPVAQAPEVAGRRAALIV